VTAASYARPHAVLPLSWRYRTEAGPLDFRQLCLIY
jgi:hypothetical protein